jgi:predicted site-specific integrase-resolvase
MELPTLVAADYLTLHEVAEQLGKSRRTVYRWSALARTGHPHNGPAFTLYAGRVVVRREDLERYAQGERIAG